MRLFQKSESRTVAVALVASESPAPVVSAALSAKTQRSKSAEEPSETCTAPPLFCPFALTLPSKRQSLKTAWPRWTVTPPLDPTVLAKPFRIVRPSKRTRPPSSDSEFWKRTTS